MANYSPQLTVRQLEDVRCTYCGDSFKIQGNRHKDNLDAVPWIEGGLIHDDEGNYYHGYKHGTGCWSQVGDGSFPGNKEELTDRVEELLREWFAKHAPAGAMLAGLSFKVTFRW